MRKNKIIRPNTLKGKEKINRIKELMGNTINESKSNSVIELTKKGPDGKIYGIVRENHEYYIKVVNSDKKNNLVVEDFNYIGGLQNKKLEAYPTYSKALKKLNLKFLSLNETYGGPKVNVFVDDNLINENYAGGFGFVEEDEDIDVYTDDNGDDVEMSDDEILIDNMVEGLDPVGQEDDDINNDGKIDDEDTYLKNRRLKITKAIKMEESEDKLESFLKTLSPEQKKSLKESLNKQTILEKAEIEKGKFTEWCRSHGFEGPNISCAKKAYKTSESARKMAVFYMNTVKPNGKDADYLKESLKKKI